MWWITPSQYLGYLMVLCDSLRMDMNFLKQTALASECIRSVEGLSNYDMGLEVGLVCLVVLGNCIQGLCMLRNCSVTEMSPVAFAFKPIRTCS